MEIHTLGTNGWYDTRVSSTICTLILDEDYAIILDAGYGIEKLSRIELGERKVHLYLSHLHLDHIAGLHILNKFIFTQGLAIFCYDGSEKYLRTIVAPPFTAAFDDLPYSVSIQELGIGTFNVPYPVVTNQLIHPGGSMGVRLNIGGKIIVYCPDTGYCENAVALSKDADLLITECAYKSGMSNELWPHLNPESALRIAEESGAKRLLLTHFDANIYKSQKERDRIKEDLNYSRKDIIISYDGMVLNV